MSRNYRGAGPTRRRVAWLAALLALILAGVVIPLVVAGGDRDERPDPCEAGYAAIHDLVDWAMTGEFHEAAWQAHAERIDAIRPGWGSFMMKAADDPMTTRYGVAEVLISLIDDCVPASPGPSS